MFDEQFPSSEQPGGYYHPAEVREIARKAASQATLKVKREEEFKNYALAFGITTLGLVSFILGTGVVFILVRQGIITP